MNIDVYVSKFEKKEGSNLLGIASIVLKDVEVKINDIRILDGEKGAWVAMPSRKKADGKHQDIVHPVNSKARNTINNAILTEFNKL